MARDTKITMSKGGMKEQIVPIKDIVIPDLWHIAMAIERTGKVADGPGCADLILECWHIAHFLKSHIEEN